MKILFSFLLCIPLLTKGQVSECFDNKEFNVRNEVEVCLSKKKWKIFEIVSIEGEKHFITILGGNKCTVNKTSLLSINEVEGYATNFIKKTAKGFYYSFEYGSKYHYEYDFYFKFINTNFYLYKVVEKLSDLSKPDSQKIKTKAVKNIPFELVNIHSYIKM